MRSSRMLTFTTVRPWLAQVRICSCSADRAPALPVPVGASGPDLLADLADQRVGELALAGGAIDPERDRCSDVVARRPARHACRSGRPVLTVAREPPSQKLSDLDHPYLPEGHGTPSAHASQAQPNHRPAGAGGCSGGPTTGSEGGLMPLVKPARNWSHAAGRRQVGCSWRSCPSPSMGADAMHPEGQRETERNSPGAQLRTLQGLQLVGRCSSSPRSRAASARSNLRAPISSPSVREGATDSERSKMRARTRYRRSAPPRR